MTDEVKHKCGIALIRLLKPLEYYQLQYGSWRYGLEKLYLLMEKQRNRGQDGAGLVSLKLDTPPGRKYFNRYRDSGSSAINDIFKKIYARFEEEEKAHPDAFNDPSWAKANLPFAAEAYLGHLRYGTFGANSTDNLHPVMRQNNWRTRNLVMAGNFNLTNVDELFNILVDLGQYPKEYSDTVTMLEKVGHFLDNENQELFDALQIPGLYQPGYYRTDRQEPGCIQGSGRCQQTVGRRIYGGRNDGSWGPLCHARSLGNQACILLPRRGDRDCHLRAPCHSDSHECEF